MTGDTAAERRLHPATFLIRTLRAVPQLVFGVPAIVGITSDIPLSYLLLVAAGGLLLSAVGAWLFWRRFRYGLGTSELVIESGILHRQRRVIPFDRIQDIDIEQGLLARLFGTAKVKIETGGSAKDEGNLDSVALADAYAIRERLRREAAQSPADTPQAQESPARDEPLLFEMDLPRLLLAGLFDFSFFYLAFIFAGNEYLQAFGIDLFELDWVEPARAAAASITWLATALAILVLILVTVVASILRTIMRNYGFRLTRAASGYRRRRGLFTLSEVVIPFRRVQVAMLRAGPVMRFTGWWGLELQTLGSDGSKASHQTAMPFGRIDEALQVLVEIHPQPLPTHEDYHRVSKRHVARQTLHWTGVLALPIVAAAFWYPAALLLLFVVPLAAAAAVLQWKHHRYCLTATHLYIRRGIVGRRLWIIPYERIQALRVAQGPLRRALGIARLDVDTAGTSVFSAPNIANLALPVAESLARRLLDAHQEARDRLRRERGLECTGRA